MVDLKILLIGDDDQAALDLEKTLKSFGYSVLLMDNPGEDAITKANDLRPDFVLIDLSPNNDLELVKKEIKNLNLPIVYLTSPAHFEKIIVPGDKLTEPDTYLSQPFNDVELKYAIDLAIYKNKIYKEFERSKNYYKTIFEHTGAATVIIEGNTIISLANSEFANLSGYSREEIEGKKSWTEFVENEDLGRMKEYHRLRRSDSTSAPLNYFFKFIDRQGNTKNIHLDIGMIPGTKKSVASLLDVTELKRIQEAVRINEKKYRSLFDNAADGIFILRGDRFIECNKKGLEIFGITLNKIIGQTPYAFSPKLQEDGELSKTKGIKFINNALKGHPQHFKWQHHRYDGTTFYTEVTLNRIKIGDEYLIQAIVRDVTESRIAEAALKKSEEKYRTALDNMMEGCQIIGPDWRYLYVNDAVSKQGRYSRTELLGHTMMEMYPGIEETDLFRVLKNSMEESNSHHLDNKFTYPDGTVRWFEISIHPIPEGIFVFSIDITERVKKQEELLFKNTLLEEKIKKEQEKIKMRDKS